MEQIIDMDKNLNGARVFLFLQGPHGPFFLQLARMLELAGYSCWRVGFNAADKVFWRPQNRFIGFKGPQDEWAETFGNLVTDKKITDLVLYGDTRDIHQIAISESRDRNITVHVFEEGYLRPYWVTYERGGSNGNSRLIQSSPPLCEDQITRTKTLQRVLNKQKLTKYNLNGKAYALPKGKLILVPGQVEDDASVLNGSHHIQTNLDLLRLVQSNNPNDVIIYKPHPDVEAQLRKGYIPTEDALLYADILAQDADIAYLLSKVAEVHTITSLTGFEALLRGVKVTTYGIPFYAGWGLTTDMASIPARRTRSSDLYSLIYTALIAYPRYFDPVTKQACPVEVVLDRLSESQVLPRPTANRVLAKLQGLLATPHPFWR